MAKFMGRFFVPVVEAPGGEAWWSDDPDLPAPATLAEAMTSAAKAKAAGGVVFRIDEYHDGRRVRTHSTARQSEG